jgi:hypothetical protein
MSSQPTIRKLRKTGDGVNTGYVLLPPKNWLDATEQEAGKKILYFTLKSRAYALLLTPQFDEPNVPPPVNSSPESVLLMLKQGVLLVKLREVRRGRNVFRLVNLPRAWVREREQKVRRQVTALSVTVEPEGLLVEAVFAENRSFGKKQDSNLD